jgi:hypothetical protein
LSFLLLPKTKSLALSLEAMFGKYFVPLKDTGVPADTVVPETVRTVTFIVPLLGVLPARYLSRLELYATETLVFAIPVS